MVQINDKMLRVIGIDFGTSSTYMNIKRYSLDDANVDSFNYIPVSFDHGESKGSLISVIRENADGTFDFGRVANEATEGSTIYRNFKMNLENPDKEIRDKARELTKRLFGYLYANYKQQMSHMGNDDDEVQTIVSYPVKWQESTVNFMIEAAIDAGFKNVRGMDEATAAISTVVSRSFDHLTSSGIFSADRPGYLLLVDMGAGTTDLALCKYFFDNTGGPVSADQMQIEVITNWPVSEDDPTFGGREFDALLTGYIRDYLEEALPPELKHMADAIASMDNNIKLWKENNVSANLNKNKPVQSCGFIRAYLQSSSKKFPEINRKNFEQLKIHADRFGGLYESLYKAVTVSDNFSAEVFTEFYERAEQIKDNTFQKAFLRVFPKIDPDDTQKCKQDSERLLSLIGRAGITRDKGGVIRDITPAVAKSYIDERGKRPQEGKSYQVINPAWRCEGKTVENGLLCSIAPPKLTK